MPNLENESSFVEKFKAIRFEEESIVQNKFGPFCDEIWYKA